MHTSVAESYRNATVEKLAEYKVSRICTEFTKKWCAEFASYMCRICNFSHRIL